MKSSKLKKALTLVLSTAMLSTFLVSCRQTSTPAKSGASPVTITFWHNYSAQTPENQTLKKVLIPKFEKENPNIKVNAVSYEWQDLHDKIVSSANTNTLPDVSRLDIAWVPEFQKSDILLQLDGKVDGFSGIASKLLSNAMDTAKINEHYYALALDTNTKMLFYNKQAFKDANLTAPTTMKEFISDAKKLSGKNKNGQQVWGLDEAALAGWNVCPYIWSCGGSITNDTYTKASGYINSTKTIAAVQMLADLVKSKSMTGYNSGDIPATDGFGTGRYMMLLDGPWKYSEMSGSYSSFKYSVVKMPSGDGGSVSVLGGEDIAMLSSAHKDASWKFMKFMTSEFAQEQLAKCGQLPANKSALDSDTVKQENYAPFIKAIKTAKIRPPVSTWSEIDNDISTSMTTVVNGKKTAKQAMDELAVKIDQLLQK